MSVCLVRGRRGIVGIVLGIANGLYDLFATTSNETISMLLDLPIALQEMVLAVWLIVKGFDLGSAGDRS